MTETNNMRETYKDEEYDAEEHKHKEINWEGRIKHMEELYPAIISANDYTTILGVGYTLDEAIFDAMERIDLIPEKNIQEFEKFAKIAFGDNYLHKLAEHFPGQYDPNGEVLEIDEDDISLCLALISQKAYDAIKKFGYDIKLCSNEGCGFALRLPEEVEDLIKWRATKYFPVKMYLGRLPESRAAIYSSILKVDKNEG